MGAIGGLDTKSTNQTIAYLKPTMFPSGVREILTALGDRLQAPGKERLTLVGTTDDAEAGTVPARMVWEIPGRLRLDRGTAGQAHTLLFDDVTGLANATQLSDLDTGIVESLLNDGPEAFLYGFYRQHAHRFLGERFRIDNGKQANYAGPWYDIYQDLTPPGLVGPFVLYPSVRKLFIFDSTNKHYVRSSYSVQRAGKTIPIKTEYSNWTTSAGQALPGSIIRSEDGASVFTFTVISATVGPAVSDGTFSGH